MSGQSTPQFFPRDGGTVKVLAVCRISTKGQDESSLSQQLVKLKQFVANQFHGPIELSVISCRGERQDRSESSAPSPPPAGRPER
jgi:hypothetical protein